MSRADVEAGVRAGLEAVIASICYKDDGPDWRRAQIRALDPAAIAATVEESPAEEAVIVPISPLETRRMVLIDPNELAALRARVAELEHALDAEQLGAEKAQARIAELELELATARLERFQ